jgi:hypothetical protein
MHDGELAIAVLDERIIVPRYQRGTVVRVPLDFVISDEGRRRSDELRQVPEIVDGCSVDGQQVVAIIGHREVGRRK